MYKLFFKRFIDIIVSISLLFLFSPLIIFFTILLFFANSGRPFFYQIRPGKNEKLFKIIKFKTMNDRKDNRGQLLSDAERLTKVGSFVRKTSLDELPQLINVLKGDMSIIGPRPLLPKYLPFYKQNERKRHSIRPGITGLAQVKGRNTLDWESRLSYDVEYVENITFINDFKIMLLTIKKVFKSDGIVVDPRSILLDLDEERNKN